MAETKKPAASSAAVKKTATKAPAAKTSTAAKKSAAPKAAAPKAEVKVEAPKAESKPAVKKVSKGNKKPAQTTRLLDKYNNEIKKSLMEKFNYSSIMQVPHLEKVVINIGVGDALTDNKALDAAVRELAQITGQHPVTTKAKKSIASFKLRE